jgi:hypothetical protein
VEGGSCSGNWGEDDAEGLTNHDLVEKVLDKLLLERSRGQEPVQIGSEQLRDKVAVAILAGIPQLDVGQGSVTMTYRSSRGEMKMSLSEMTFSCRRCLSSFSSRYVRLARTGVLKGFMIFLMATFWLVSWSRAELKGEESRLAWCHRMARRPRHPARQMGAGPRAREQDVTSTAEALLTRPDQRRPCPRAGGPNTYRRGQFGGKRASGGSGHTTYLDVISKVVPNIWARMNSAMVSVCWGLLLDCCVF